MAASRREARGRGKSDSIDALSVARAALREGLETLPAAHLAGPGSTSGCSSIIASGWSAPRVALNNTLQWQLHDLWPELRLPGSSLFYGQVGRRASHVGLREPSRRCAFASPATNCAASASSPRPSTRSKLEIADLVARIAPQLLCEPGFGPLTAAKLVGEIAGAERFATDAKLARAAGVAPIPVSSGNTNRHRLDRGGNRQINAALHRIAVTRARCHPETRAYIDRKRPKARPPAKPSAASSATSPAASGTSSSRTHTDTGEALSRSIS